MLRRMFPQTHGGLLGLVLVVATAMCFAVWCADPFSYESSMGPIGDARGYNVLAQNLVEHGTFSRETEPPFTPSGRRVPGYPLFIATVYQFVGPNVHAVKFVQILFGPAVCLLAFAVGKIAFKDERIGLIAAGLIAVSPPLIGYNNHLLTEGLFTLLLMGATFASYSWTTRQSVGWAVCCGILWGVLTLVRPEAALLPVALVPVVIFLSRKRRTAAWQSAVALVAVAILVGPWIYRNHVLLGKPCLITAEKGNPIDRDLMQSVLRDDRKCAEHGLWLKHPNSSSYLYADPDAAQRRFEAAMAADVQDPHESDLMYFVRRPHKYLLCCLGRFIGVWKPTSWSDTFAISDDVSTCKSEGQYVQLGLKALLLLFDALVLTAGGIGFLWSLSPKHRHLWIISATIISFSATYLLVTEFPRHRVPLLPFLLLLGVWAFETAYSRFFPWKPTVEPKTAV